MGYGSFFGFTEKPFKFRPDPRFFYSNVFFNRAHAGILTGIRRNRGLIVLSGVAGTGKTALLRRCWYELSEEPRIHPVWIDNALLSFDDLLNRLGDTLGLALPGEDYLRRIDDLQACLQTGQRRGESLALLIDDAHDLEHDVLNNLLRLRRAEDTPGDLLQIVLCGLPALENRLPPSATDAVRFQLCSLKSTEVSSYIYGQIWAVGYRRRDLFSAQAIQRISWYSKGRPRTINTLCDSALYLASLESRRTVTADCIEEAAQQCLLPQGI